MKPAEYYERELLERKQRLEAGHLPALYEAVEACALWRIALPEWTSIAVLNLISAHYFHAPAKGGRGKPNPKSRYTRDYIDWLRWLKFESACRQLRFDPSQRARGGRPKHGEPTKSKALSEARLLLKGTFARNSTSRQVWESWVRVKAAKDSGDVRYQAFP
jgi:hypothetical protein